MFGFERQISIEGLGNVIYNKEGFFETEMALWDKKYEIKLYIESNSGKLDFNENQKNAFKEYVQKREELQACIEEYYIQNYNEIIEDYYIAYRKNWKSSCKTQKEFEEIINSYNTVDKKALKLLLSYFQPQSIIFAQNGECALIGFIAVADDQGIAVTIRPILEIMTQDEYYDEYQGESD